MSINNIDNILNEMDIILEDAFSVPLSGKRMVDTESLGQLIEKIRLNLPQEILEARRIYGDRSRIMAEAKEKADKIIKAAEERARILVGEQEIVKNSKRLADDLELTAKKRAKSISDSSFTLCEDVLAQTEEQLAASSADIKRRLAVIRQKRKGGNL